MAAMSAIKYVTGDATAPGSGGNRIICHVCNDIGGWGRGFVLAISKRWPEAEARYRAWYESGEPGGFLLGGVQLVEVEAELWVANMIAQHGVKAMAGVPPIRYDALRACLELLAGHAQNLTASVHMPRIGCGLAGGTWSEVEAIIADALSSQGVPVHVYDLGGS
jgi:O-acetyl-ADP-ribose deacetylase (regulator of RNase III)